MANKITLTFAGDADSLTKAAKQAEKATSGVADTTARASKSMGESSKASVDLGGKMGHLGSAVSGASDALDTVGGSLQAVIDLEQAGTERAARLARAMNDVEQAQEDLQQALRDGAQAQIDSDQAALDLEQANLDAAQATRDYATAVKEHGANSAEAKQAAIDLKQANIDAKQANEDAAQATRDASQATIDAKSAQLDLNEAQREAHPPEMQEWADKLQLITPLISAAVGVIGLLTAAQWLWNASLWASPVTWIVLAIAALVAIIVIIATKTTWFQDIWNAAWGGIKKAASATWDWMKNTLWPGLKNFFTTLGDVILWPFKTAFRGIASLWNNTVGRISFTVPDWVPGVGGAHFAVPKIPTFHRGGIVPGSLGAETLAVLQAGERVSPAGGGGHAETILLGSDGSEVGDFLLGQIRDAISRRGGDPGRVLGTTRG